MRGFPAFSLLLVATLAACTVYHVDGAVPPQAGALAFVDCIDTKQGAHHRIWIRASVLQDSTLTALVLRHELAHLERLEAMTCAEWERLLTDADKRAAEERRAWGEGNRRLKVKDSQH